MVGLPVSIEGYLRESGFTATELLVLRHLLGGSSATLRELAAKTGKSTGILDQATKKLLQKHILHRERVNGTSKYAIPSLQALTTWVEERQHEQMSHLRRRAQDIGSFLSSVAFQRRRPALEYFEGEDAFECVLEHLSQVTGDEVLQYLPVVTKEEDDLHRELRQLWTRRRRNHGVRLRVIAPDTPLGRRFRERDPLEARQTILVPSDRYRFTVEQIIAGDWLACCDHEARRASLIELPALATEQRQLFEAIWQETQEDRCPPVVAPVMPVVQLCTACGMSDPFIAVAQPQTALPR
jgi:hypothetical protein